MFNFNITCNDQKTRDFLMFLGDIEGEHWTEMTSSHWRCSVRKVFLEIPQIHKKTPVPESLF